ncbi:MAG: carbohydrate-binding family 9-like protein [Bacteroidales bacterium]
MIVSRISCGIDQNPLPEIGHPNWVPAPGVSASFDISHRGTSILLKYMVREPQVRAVNTGFNSPVWEDSCVEFFISLEGDDHYYNFEFNAIGTVLGAYGPDRHHREWIPEETLELIQVNPSLGWEVIANREGDVRWELDIILPVKLFCHHRVTDLAGNRARANFYKCGDKLDKPHFLSWNPVLTPEPNFHTPQFFGALDFM